MILQQIAVWSSKFGKHWVRERSTVLLGSFSTLKYVLESPRGYESTGFPKHI